MGFGKRFLWGKVMIGGLIYMILAVVIHQVEAGLTMSYYQIPEYFGVWSKLIMPEAGPPPPSFLLISLFFSVVTGITLAAFYDFLKELLPPDKWSRVVNFTVIIFSLGVIFFTLPAYLLFNLPLGLLICWLVSSAVILLLASAVFVRVLV